MRTLGTAGHIDHGKTALVTALTGTNTDRLPEERARGISIELGYAALDLDDDIRLSIVDVPGHERFVRTMVAGATGIDLALLCVACDDGVMPQTREHLAILELLQVERVVVALTKCDLVDAEGVELAREDVNDALAPSAFAGSPLIAVSARLGSGLDELRAALATAARASSPRRQSGRARLPVDRVFSLRGVGTVLTGTLWSGRLAVGDRVALVPSGRSGRIRSLEAHDRAVEAVEGGGRVAASLVGVERREVRRGELLTTGAALPTSFRLDVALDVPAGAPGVQQGQLVEVLHGTASLRGRVILLDRAALAPGEHGLAQLRLDRAVPALRGDRAIIRALAPPATVAGAVVLDPHPRRHAGRAAVPRLERLRTGSAAEILEHEVGPEPLAADALVTAGLLEPDEVAAGIEALHARDALVRLDGGFIQSRAGYARRSAEVSARLAERARTHPLSPGLPPAALVATGPGRDALLAKLERDGIFEREGALAVSPGTRASSAAVSEAAAKLVAAIAAEPFAPPRPDDLSRDLGLDAAALRALLAVLEGEGTIVRLPDGLAVSRVAFDEARAVVIATCERQGLVTLAELRDATGSSRRYAQALLERLDSDGVTRRIGDHRVLRRTRAG